MGSPFQLIIYTPDQAQAHILQSCNITQYEQNKMTKKKKKLCWEYYLSVQIYVIELYGTHQAMQITMLV